MLCNGKLLQLDATTALISGNLTYLVFPHSLSHSRPPLGATTLRPTPPITKRGANRRTTKVVVVVVANNSNKAVAAVLLHHLATTAVDLSVTPLCPITINGAAIMMITTWVVEPPPLKLGAMMIHQLSTRINLTITDGVVLTVDRAIIGAITCPILAVPTCRWRVLEVLVVIVVAGELLHPSLIQQVPGDLVEGVVVVVRVVQVQINGTTTVLALAEGWMMVAPVSGVERVLVYRVQLLLVEVRFQLQFSCILR